MPNNFRFVYFGGEPLGVPVQEALAAAGYLPSLVVCNPDRPAGRRQQLTAPPVKTWAEAHDVPVWQPLDLKDQAAATAKLSSYDLFIVVAYNHILPGWLLELPKHKVLNVHPSLLPKFRGPSPIRAVILANERVTGVSIIELDTKMDHGPLVAQAELPIAESEWPLRGTELDQRLATLGGALLVSILPSWIAGMITPLPQVHGDATYTQKMTKADGELQLDPHNLPSGEAAYQCLLKIKAYDGWPGTFFIHQGKRIKITVASIDEDGTLKIEKIIPEGKPETAFATWLAQR